MHDGLKIMIGAGVTALMAWAVHGPMGQGKAFVTNLEQQAKARLATRGLADVEVTFATNPYSRMAHLSGTASLLQQDAALKLMRTLGGTSGAVWGDAKPTVNVSALVDLQNAPDDMPKDLEAWQREQLGAVLNSMAAPLPGDKKAAQPGPNASPTPTATLAPSTVVVPTPTPTPAPTPRSMPIAPPRPTPVARPTTSPAPVVTAGRPSANPCQRGIDGALAGRVMSFRSGSAWLNPQSTKMIDDVAAVLKRCRTYAIEIGGHTDGAGDEGVNRAISQERADRVRQALIARGIPAGAVVARGYGSARPIRAGNTLDPANRRIAFTISRGGA